MSPRPSEVSPGSEASAIELGTDGYGWIDVQSATEPQQRPFEEVKAKVKEDYVEVETAHLVREIADKLVDRLKVGEDLAKVAADAGNKEDKLEGITRTTSPPGLTQEAVTLAFVLPKGDAASTPTADRSTRVVFRVADIKSAEPPSPVDEKKLVDQLQREYQNDMLNAYVQALQAKLGVKINEKELSRLTGADVVQ